MKRFIVLSVALLAGCATAPPMVWDKDGSTLTEFNTTKLACLQQSQQQYGSTYVNPTLGLSSSGMTTNGNLFNTCMNSNGWALVPKAVSDANNERRRQQLQEFNTAQSRLTAEAAARCTAAEYASFFQHVPCKPKDTTLEQMADEGRATTVEQRATISRIAKLADDASTELIQLLRKGPGRGQELADLSAATNSESQANVQNLYQGKITWGEFNARRKKLNEDFASSWARITGK